MKAIPFFEQYEFKAWEKALMVFSMLLFLGSFYLYVTDYPLRRYLFNIDDEGHGHSVGTVSLKQGGLRRQFTGEAEFKSIDLAEPLYDEDTIVTGSESSATLKLDDGSSIEMAPNTMVRLHFQTNLTLAGISRAATVDVVTGDVKPSGSGESERVVIRRTARPIVVPRVAVAALKPTPKAEVKLIKGVELIAPRNGTELMLDKGTLVDEKKVSFAWKVAPEDRPVQLTLWKLASRGQRAQVYREVLADKGGQGVAEWTLKNPGRYEWELRGPKGEPISGGRKTVANFTLKPDFESIEALEPLVGGEVLSAGNSSKLHGSQKKNFDITLRWKPFPGASQYRILVKTTANAVKPVLDKQVSGSQFLFNKDRVLSGQIYYQVSSALKSGFIVHSEVRPFEFVFLAPVLATPPNHARITLEELEAEEGSILITWQKTNFTEWYEVQVASDPEFKTIVAKEKLQENFYLFQSPAEGKYYWRVRSSSKSVLSPFTAPNDVSVVP